MNIVNPFDRMYEGTPPWEIGRPQPFVEELLAEGRITGRVLDVGCGTGENALLLATAGLAVHGVDFATRAVERAQRKAQTREVSATFEVRDALELTTLGRTFDTIIDSGVFHVFSDDARSAYARNLAAVARPGTSLFVVCFSDQEPDWGGPRRVSQRELRSTFGSPWAIETIEATRYATLMSPNGAQAWLTCATFVGRPVSRGN